MIDWFVEMNLLQLLNIGKCIISKGSLFDKNYVLHSD